MLNDNVLPSVTLWNPWRCGNCLLRSCWLAFTMLSFNHLPLVSTTLSILDKALTQCLGLWCLFVAVQIHHIVFSNCIFSHFSSATIWRPRFSSIVDFVVFWRLTRVYWRCGWMMGWLGVSVRFGWSTEKCRWVNKCLGVEALGVDSVLGWYIADSNHKGGALVEEA